MPTFGRTSMNNLNTAHEDLITIMKEAIKEYDFTVICGYRGKDAQEKAVAGGFSKLHYPNSKHNKQPAMAVDCIPYPSAYSDIPEFTKMADIIKSIANNLYQNGAITHQLQWGGDWTKFKDKPHFELI